MFYYALAELAELAEGNRYIYYGTSVVVGSGGAGPDQYSYGIRLVEKIADFEDIFETDNGDNLFVIRIAKTPEIKRLSEITGLKRDQHIFTSNLVFPDLTNIAGYFIGGNYFPIS